MGDESDELDESEELVVSDEVVESDEVDDTCAVWPLLASAGSLPLAIWM